MLKVKQSFIIFLTASLLLMPITTCAETIYDFSDEAQAKFEQAEQNQAKEIKTEPQVQKAKKNSTKKQTEETYKIITTINKTIDGSAIYIDEDTSFTVILQSTINTSSLSNNDTVAASLENNWIYKGKLIAPYGSIVYGKAIDTKRAGLFYGNGEMTVMFNTIMLPNGEQIRLATNAVTVKKNGNRVGKSVLHVVGGALVGVVSGVLYSLIAGGSVTNGIIYGASVGGAGGLVTAATQKGEDAEIPAGTIINIRLTKPMNAVPYTE